MSEYDIALLDWEDDMFPDGTDDRHFVIDDDYKADWAVRKMPATSCPIRARTGTAGTLWSTRGAMPG